MEESKKRVDDLVDHLFRTESGKLVSLLTKLFGSAHIELAEDVVQDTLLTALNHWSVGNIPTNPAAWITQVAKRKAINELNRRASRHKYARYLVENNKDPVQFVEEYFLEKEIEDSQLRMIFTCCHPFLSVESQIALTLKTLCGFGIKEIAAAFFTTESIINKRLYRAKQKIRTEQIPFNIPMGSELEPRLDSVCLTLYLLFNEGYKTSYSPSLIRKDFCMEAMRLTRLLTVQFKQYPKLYALLSLMCFQAARLDARMDDKGAIIIFEDQNRKLWDHKLIIKGVQYLKKASKGEEISSYHLEAGIAAEHCLAKSFEDTNWHSIYQQYILLDKIKQNPIIKLNLAIIESKINSYEKALDKLYSIEEEKVLEDYYLLPATQGIFYLKIKEYKLAKTYLLKAKHLSQVPQVINLINKQLEYCEKESN